MHAVCTFCYETIQEFGREYRRDFDIENTFQFTAMEMKIKTTPNNMFADVFIILHQWKIELYGNFSQTTSRCRMYHFMLAISTFCYRIFIWILNQKRDFVNQMNEKVKPMIDLNLFSTISVSIDWWYSIDRASSFKKSAYFNAIRWHVNPLPMQSSHIHFIERHQYTVAWFWP